MSARLTVERLIDRLKSGGAPNPVGAQMKRYDSSADRTELAGLIANYQEAWPTFPYQNDQDRLELANNIAVQAAKHHGVSENHELILPITRAIEQMIAVEPGFFPVSQSSDPNTLSPLQMGEMAQDIGHRLRFLTDETVLQAALNTPFHLAAGLIQNLGAAILPADDSGAKPLTTEVISLVDQPHQFMTQLLAHFLSSDEVQENGLYGPLCRQLYRNILEASGVVVDPDEPLSSYDNDNPTLPHQCKREVAQDVAKRYFARTPILDLLTAPAPFDLPQTARFEHCHVLGGIGHGKTQCLQYLIHEDLVRAVTDEKLSLVVIDSQGSLIRNISSCALFHPEHEFSLADRFILIDPSDIERPPALNLFNPGLDRMDSYTPRQREVAFNSLVDIYGRFFGALLGADLTARQGTVFRYLARLMLTIDGATIHTLIALMDDARPFAHHIEKLDSTARRFFEKEFTRKSFTGTRNQIKDRLYAVLSIPTFDRLFSAPKSKINFFDALNSGKIILIDTAKGLLKEEGTAILGRFMLALIEHAVTERYILPETERNPVFLYMDEAHEYFDDTVESLIVEARKYRCGLTLAHQNLAQLSPKLRAIFTGNTTIKMVGGITDNDARSLASDMRTSPEFLMSMRKHEQESYTEFALSVRNTTPQAIKVDIPFGHMESHPTLEAHHRATLLEINRLNVGYDPEPEMPDESEPPSGHEEAKPEERPSDERTNEPADDTISSHTAAQRELAGLARSRGFGAEIEHSLPNSKRIDLALFGHGLRVAIEISVTNRKDYEAANIEKALEAGFDTIWMIADNPIHREEIAKIVRQTLPPEDIAKVAFSGRDEAVAWLERFNPPQTKQSRIAGYEVETELVSPSTSSDHRYRIEQIVRIVRR